MRLSHSHSTLSTRFFRILIANFLNASNTHELGGKTEISIFSLKISKRDVLVYTANACTCQFSYCNNRCVWEHTHIMLVLVDCWVLSVYTGQEWQEEISIIPIHLENPLKLVANHFRWCMAHSQIISDEGYYLSWMLKSIHHQYARWLNLYFIGCWRCAAALGVCWVCCAMTLCVHSVEQRFAQLTWTLLLFSRTTIERYMRHTYAHSLTMVEW